MAIVEQINRRVDAASLGIFRVLFGACLLADLLFFRGIRAETTAAKLHFPYFSFLVFPEGFWLQALLAAAFIGALGICFGLFHRVSAALYTLAAGYFFLADETGYVNHYYLILLISFLLIFCDAGAWASLNRLRKRSAPEAGAPFWNIGILRLQFVAVYFFSGLSKLNYDWLHGEPLRHILRGRWLPGLGQAVGAEWVTLAFSYGGLLFDLSIGFLLLFRKTRWIGIAGVLLFNVANLFLFRIGVFPFLMIAALVIFGEPDWPRRLLARLRRQEFVPIPSPMGMGVGRAATVFVIIYAVVQILMPLRHWLYPGDVSWTDEGHQFSWRMMTHNKRAKTRVTVTDPVTGASREIDLREDLTSKQVVRIGQRPEMLVQYAHYLRDRLKKEGMERPVIRADVMVSLNFRPGERLIDPEANLAEAEYSWFRHAEWILPFPESARTLKHER